MWVWGSCGRCRSRRSSRGLARPIRIRSTRSAAPDLIRGLLATGDMRSRIKSGIALVSHSHAKTRHRPPAVAFHCLSHSDRNLGLRPFGIIGGAAGAENRRGFPRKSYLRMPASSCGQRTAARTLLWALAAGLLDVLRPRCGDLGCRCE